MLAEELPDLANLFAGGFVVGLFLGAAPPSAWLFAVGIVVWVVGMALALVFAEGAS